MSGRIENIRMYFSEIKRMSTSELMQLTHDLELKEKKTLAMLIAHISEISFRKAHLDRGYPNLFQYVTRELNVSEGAAGLRIQVARVCQRFPEILAALADNRINLSVAGKLSPVLTEENCTSLISRCTGMSARAVEELLIQLNLTERAEAKPTIRPSHSNASTFALPPVTAAAASAPESDFQVQVTAPLPLPVQADRAEGAAPEPAKPALRYNVKFSMDQDLKKNLDRLAEVLGVVDSEASLEQILTQAINDSLDKRDPIRKEDRNSKRKARAEERVGDVTPVADANKPAPKVLGIAVNAEVRAAALKRADYQCEYESSPGVRCSARSGLHIDHVHPKAFGGLGSLDNTQVLCAAHNMRKSEHEMGESFIRNAILRRSCGDETRHRTYDLSSK